MDTKPPPSVERLAHELCDRGPAEAMAGELAAWLAGSAAFRAFVEGQRAKIHKKLRSAADPEAVRDVRAELLAARLLLADRRIGLAFEAYGSGRGGPDFTLTFRAGRPLNLEVTRLRRLPDAAGLALPFLAKLRQLPTGAPNALLVAIDAETAEALDVVGTVRLLRARADAKDEAFFVARGFRGTRAFYERFLRLGTVLAWCEGATGDARATLWTNPSARIAVPAPAARAWLACLRAGSSQASSPIVTRTTPRG